MKMRVSKGLLSFLSGLGFTGLAFYIWLFTFEKGNIFYYSIITSALGGVMIYFAFIAFSVMEPPFKINKSVAGFIGGILSMFAVIVMAMSHGEKVELIDKLHPITTFFLAIACTVLLIWPEKEEKMEW